MATLTRTERRKRGIVGWFFLILFWGFNAIMAFAIFAGIDNNAQDMQGMSGNARDAYTAGTVIGIGFLVMLWAAGAVILGLFVLLTAGKKVIVETTT